MQSQLGSQQKLIVFFVVLQWASAYDDTGDFYGTSEYHRHKNFRFLEFTRGKYEPLEGQARFTHYKTCHERDLPAPADTGHPSFVYFWPEYLMPLYFLPENEFEYGDIIKKKEEKEHQKSLERIPGGDNDIRETRVNRSKNRAHDPWIAPSEQEAGFVLAAWILVCVVAQFLYFFFIIIFSYFTFRLLFYRFLWLSVAFWIKTIGRYIYVKYGKFVLHVNEKTKPYWMKGVPVCHFNLPAFFRRPGESEVPDELIQPDYAYEEWFSEDEQSYKDGLSDDLDEFDRTRYSTDSDDSDSGGGDQRDSDFQRVYGTREDNLLFRQPHVDEVILGRSRATTDYLPRGFWNYGERGSDQSYEDTGEDSEEEEDTDAHVLGATTVGKPKQLPRFVTKKFRVFNEKFSSTFIRRGYGYRDDVG